MHIATLVTTWMASSRFCNKSSASWELNTQVRHPFITKFPEKQSVPNQFDFVGALYGFFASFSNCIPAESSADHKAGVSSTVSQCSDLRQCRGECPFSLLCVRIGSARAFPPQIHGNRGCGSRSEVMRPVVC